MREQEKNDKPKQQRRLPYLVIQASLGLRKQKKGDRIIIYVGNNELICQSVVVKELSTSQKLQEFESRVHA
jgi:hypothetical protein